MDLKPQRPQGLTLIEIIIALILISILSAMTFPSLKTYLQHNKATTMQTELLQAIEEARELSLQYSTPITVCGSDNGLTCSNDWSKGVVVFFDEAETGKINRNNIIHSIKFAFKEGKLMWRSFPYYHDDLRFTRQGLLSTNGTFSYFYHDAPVWTIVVNKSGLVRGQ